MKNFLIIVIASLAMVLCLRDTAGAVGIGAYGGFSYNEGKFQEYEGLDDVGSAYRANFYWAGAGLVVDTAVAKNKIFNYRMNLGIGKLWQEPISGSYNIDIEGIRAELISSFGFGIVKISFMRMWLGPQLGLRVSYIEADDFNTNFTSVFISPGAVLGFNFNIGSLFTIALDGGFRYNAGLNFVTSQDSSLLDYNSEYTHGPEGFVNVSVLFRFGDNYDGARKKSESEREQKETTSEPEKEKAESDKSAKARDKNKVSSDEDYWFGD
ncbi:MAG TPA: hypothetical protein PK573_05430 [Spirochaetota bacterium]|nr:hypothetical protein [Spirochaetota bacterium]HRZ26054.1 hypothetical protein [Spirochaetota bacterium]HSA14981.1 hypothetical protein [Spirochaetota bacterium]